MESTEPPESPEPEPDAPKPQGTGNVFTQPFRNQPVAARVPGPVARGAFTTGVLIQDGPNEFVIDFLQALSRPPQIVSRVVLSPPIMEALVRTLDENLNKYIQSFGPPAPLPQPQNPNRPSIQELYETFKLPEELWSGSYANSVLIGHNPSEFFMDFITGFFPTAAVSSRVFLAAQQAPRVLQTLRTALQQHNRRMAGLPPLQPPPPEEENPPT